MQDEQLENALTSLDRYNKEADKIKDFITTTQVMHKCSVNHVNCPGRHSLSQQADRRIMGMLNGPLCDM